MHVDLQVANRAATLRKNKSGGIKFRLDTLEELTMLYKGSTIKNGKEFHDLEPDQFFVLDHQKIRDSEKRLTEVSPPSSPSHQNSDGCCQTMVCSSPKVFQKLKEAHDNYGPEGIPIMIDGALCYCHGEQWCNCNHTVILVIARAL